MAADPALDEARLRLGRLLWRLGEAELARASLEAMLAPRDPPLSNARGESGPSSSFATLERSRDRYLAHLFLGRVYEDARRLEEAKREYRATLEIEPQAQAAAVALGHVLQMAGDTGPARQALEQSLRHAGRRTHGDPYWGYLLGSVDRAEALFDELRRETLR